MRADYYDATIHATTRKRASRALIFLLLWLGLMSIPLLSYNAAAQQDFATPSGSVGTE